MESSLKESLLRVPEEQHSRLHSSNQGTKEAGPLPCAACLHTMVVKIDTEEVGYQKGTMDRRKGSRDVASLASISSRLIHQEQYHKDSTARVSYTNPYIDVPESKASL